ncbi:cytochrome C oxidase subunit IV family protein [Hyalangium minutum]|uniref:Cytochrome c oxidase polypeptide IV n=1 Tax=Hyalangium minutum TaxID=394096 RepID=A0A085WAR6_9BACT|nr:cytochrome C oxidase subunit IV family protein [Hyalangium minutum]KFE64779.1 Cytochrome c oxidase polypeptide IV [Hyalangium minutum]
MAETRSKEQGGRAHGGYGKALIVGVGLLSLTTLSFALSRLHVGAWGLVVAVAIAVIKVTLIAFFFMHLSERAGGPRLVFATAVLFVIILIGLILVEASDRPQPAMPPGPFSAERLPGLDEQPQAAPTREPPSEQTP